MSPLQPDDGADLHQPPAETTIRNRVARACARCRRQKLKVRDCPFQLHYTASIRALSRDALAHRALCSVTLRGPAPCVGTRGFDASRVRPVKQPARGQPERDSGDSPIRCTAILNLAPKPAAPRILSHSLQGIPSVPLRPPRVALPSGSASEPTALRWRSPPTSSVIRQHPTRAISRASLVMTAVPRRARRVPRLVGAC